MMLQRCLVLVGLTGLGCAGLAGRLAPPPTFPAGSPVFFQRSTGLYDAEGQFLAALGGRSREPGVHLIDGTLDGFFLLSDPSQTVRVARRQGDTFVVTTLTEDAVVVRSLGRVAAVRPAGSEPARIIDMDGTVLQDGIVQLPGGPPDWRPEYWWTTEVRPVPFCLAAPDGSADEERCGWIDANGQWLAKGPVYRRVTGFETGFASGLEGYTRRWFLPSGAELPDVTNGAQYWMTPSSDGLQIIGNDRIEHSNHQAYSIGPALQVVDRDGVRREDVDLRVVIEMTTQRLCTEPSDCEYRFHEERAPVWLHDELGYQQAYLGPDGAFAIGPAPCKLDVLSGPFQEGRAFFCEGDGYWLIDSTGKHLAGPWPAWDPGPDSPFQPEHYPAGLFFAEGLAAVPVDGGWAYIDRSGAVVLPGPFTAALPFRAGIARVHVGDEVRYIDARGQWVLQPVEP